ncbi:MAG TPA: hypothetical protein VFU13_20245 [Steroidobacteraceae bacterium]|nr:hypothetical protein [Steroidobacteraceae bacterium]
MRRVHVDIGTLVLRGYPRNRHEAIARELRTELSRVMDGGPRPETPAARPAGIGAQIARQIAARIRS